MENRAHALIAVCFLIVFCAAAVLIYFWLTSSQSEPLSYRIVTGQSVAGLAPQSQVEFKGIAVGHVESIRFDPADRARVIVDIHVRRGTYITHATYAVLARQGLIGGTALELKLGKGSPAPLVTSAAHPAQIPLRKGFLAKLEASAREDMQNLNAVLASAKALLGAENRHNISATIRQLDAATAKLVAIETQLQPALQHMPKLVASARQSLKESHALLANANKLAKAAYGPVRKIGNATGTYAQLGRNLNAQTVPDIDALSRSLSRTSRLLQALLRELQAKPQSLIFGPPQRPPGPGEPGFNAAAKGSGGHG